MKKGLVILLSLLMLIAMVGCSKHQAPEDTNSKGTTTAVQQSTTLATNSGVSSEGTSVLTGPTSEFTTIGGFATTGSATAGKPTTVNKPTATKKPTTTSRPTTQGQVENRAKLQTLNYNEASNCIDGVMLVKNDVGKLGMINSAGKLLVDYKYDSGLICVGGYVVFDKQYVYDKTGKLVFEDKNATIEHCGNGVVLITEYGEWKPEGDHSECEGVWSSRKVYKKLDGTVIYAFFNNDTGDYGQFNKQGYAWLIEEVCPECWDQRLAEIIDLKGNVVNRLRNLCAGIAGNKVWALDNDGYVLVDDGVCYGVCTYMNLETVKEDIFEGVWKGETLYSLIEDVNNVRGYAAVNDDGQYCCTLDSLSVMSYEDSYYLFDIEKNKVIAEYPFIGVTASKYILVKNSSGKWGYIDRTGKEYKFYDDATYFDDGYAMVKIDGLLYVIDEKFNIVSEGIEGDSASASFNKFFSVKRGEESVLVKFEP